VLTTIVPNFNHAKFLPEALTSLIDQIRPSDELIVIDDHSTDHSVDIIESLLPRHPNARLVRNSQNKGCNANLNIGLRMARGSFVHFAAADDLFNSDLYRRGVEMLETYTQAAIFSARSDVVDASGRQLQEAMPRPGYPLSEPGFICPAAAARYLLREDSWFMGNTTIYRTSCLREEGGFPEELFALADGFMCRFLTLKYGACFAPNVLGSWRRTAGGMASSLSENLGSAQVYFAAAEARMSAAGTVFPTAYVRRWRARQEFAIRRRALSNSKGNVPLNALAPVQRWFSEKVLTVWLAVRWRPWDIGNYIRQKVVGALKK
jgi:glycosyltransferase involved in cell wall biosynthesis